MNQTLWNKTLSDGTKELGTEELINKGEASWTNGRQDIVECLLSFHGTDVILKCKESNGKLASWKQLDHNFSSMVDNKSWCAARVVSCTILDYKYISLHQDGSSFVAELVNYPTGFEIPKGADTFVCVIDNSGFPQVGFEGEELDA